MNKRITISFVVAALLLLAGVYLWGPTRTPAGQRPLSTLSSANFSEFEAEFDAAADSPRLVLLLSPT
jgi:hypothetical protein